MSTLQELFSRFADALAALNDRVSEHTHVQDGEVDPEDFEFSEEGGPIPYTAIAEALTDGDAPASSPTPDVILGGPGYLVVKWTPVSNPDLVTYEVHVSQSDDFTPDANTLAGETKGSLFFVRREPDGTDEGLALDYGEPDVSGTGSVEYFVKLIAKDADGSAAAGTQGSGFLRQVNSEDLVVDSVTANQIASSSITADHLDATLLLSTTIVAGAAADDGPRLVMGPEGLTLYDADNVELVRMPTDGQPVFFDANIEAAALDVRGDMVLRGDNNVMAQDSVLYLSSKVPDPTTPPSLSLEWDQFQLGTGSGTRRGIQYIDAGGASEDTPTYLVCDATSGSVREFDATTGAFIRNKNIGELLFGATITRQPGFNSYLVVLAQDAIGRFFLRSYLWSTWGAQVDQFQVTGQVPSNCTPGLMNGGEAGDYDSSVFLLTTTSNTGTVRMRQHAVLTGVFSAVGNSDTDIPVSNISATRVAGGVYDGTDYWLDVTSGEAIPNRAIIPVDDGTFEQDATRQFKGRQANPTYGVTYNNTDGQFVTLQQTQFITLHTNWDPSSGGVQVWCKYAWVNGAGRTAESAASPPNASAFSFSRRSKLVVSTPNVPSGADRVAVYIARNATLPADSSFLGESDADNGLHTTFPIIFEDLDESDSNNPLTATTFADGTPSVVRPGPAVTNFAPLKGNGDGFMPIGAVIPFAVATAPTGWLVCDGSAVSRTTYAGLFAIIGTTFGAGDGSTTFNVPDLRSRAVYGLGTHADTDAMGENDGVAVGSRSMSHDAHGSATNTTAGGAAARLTGGQLADGNNHNEHRHITLQYIIKT